MRSSKQFKRLASSVAGVAAAAAFLIGQPWLGVSLCTVAAFFGLSALHRVGGRQERPVLRAPIPTLEQRKRMFQEMA